MMARISEALDALNRVLFRVVSWFSLLLVLLGGAIVLLRYGFDFGSIAMQEALVYLHAAILLAAAAHTLSIDGHVRVDIFYRGYTPRTRCLVDGLGVLLLLWPLAVLILWSSWGYVGDAWARREASAEAGGLPWVYLLKTLILLFAVQLLLQGLVQLHRAWRGLGAGT